MRRLTPIVGRLAASQGVVLGALLVLGAGAGTLMLISTPYGIGINSDSVAYIEGANNLVSGHGISESSGGGEVKPITHWPPLYSISLAGIELLGLSQESAARWLGALLFAGNVLVAGLAAWTITGSGIIALACGWAVLMSASLIYLHSFAMSEPLYLLLSLSGLLSLSIYTRRLQAVYLLAASTFIGLAFLTRYAGVSVVMAGLATLILFGPKDRRRRVRGTLIFLGITLAPMATWLVRNTLVAGTATNRRLGINPVTPDLFKQPFSVAWRTLLPFEFSYPALWGMVAFLVAIPVWLTIARRWARICPWARRLARPLPGRTLIAILVIYAILYAVVLVATVLFLDASTPIDDRLMSPLIELLLIVAASTGYAIWVGLDGRRVVQVFLAAAGLALLISYPVESASTVRILRVNGGGYAHRGFRPLPILAAVRELPAGTVIYTNERELLYFYTGRGAYSLPVRINSGTGQVSDYRGALERMRQDIRTRGGVMVLFDSISRQHSFPPTQELIEGMLTLREVPGGVIYGYAPLPSASARFSDASAGKHNSGVGPGARL